MCVDITCEGLRLSSVAAMDDIIYDNLTYDYLYQDVCEIVVLRLMI